MTERRQSYWTTLGQGAMVLGCGALSALIFPPFKLAAAGYAAMIWFLAYLLMEKRSKRQAFWLAYGYGAAFFVVGFSWISQALLIDDGKLAAFIAPAMLAIGGFFGLFWAIPALLAAMVTQMTARVMVFCGCYVVLEWVRSFIFSGFPWNLLGSALCFEPRLIQGAAYIGTYGLSLLLLLMCSGAAMLLYGLKQRRFYGAGVWLLAVPLGGLLLFGLRFYHLDGAEGKPLYVRLVQPSIPQTFKWHPALAAQNFHQYIELSRLGQKEGYRALDEVDLVVWGETASPYFLDRDAEHLEAIRAAVPLHGFLVTGMLRSGIEKGHLVPYNSLVVINHDGKIKDYYDKSHLVPFGEFLPLRQYLPDFMRPVADIVGDLGRGEKYKNIEVDGLPLMGGAICYESIFPKEVLNPQRKPEILLVLANDGWYGISSGPYQHLAAAQLRAVEEGVTVIRSANNGISAVIAPNGRINGVIDLNQVGIADVMVKAPFAYFSWYGKYGNLLPLGLILLLGLMALASKKR